ncbi:MAG: DNA translocase FtsK [Lachnospiraceae bacterium]|nr:DNA translocase FtsK [Lachnospiraceae bacterium]
MANTGRNGSNKSRSKTVHNNSRNNVKKNSVNKRKDYNPRRNEIYLFIYLAITVFLLLSNFGWCGPVGRFFSHILFGLFGTISYILPLYIFVTAGFLLSNGAQKKVVKRVLCIGLFLIVAAFIFQMTTALDTASLKTLYSDGVNDKKGGGAILGGILILLYKLIGLTGSIIVTVLLAIIGIIVVLDVSIIDMLKYKPNIDDDDYDDEFDFEGLSENVDNSEKNRDMLEKIKVLESEEDKKKNKKSKNKRVPEEEVHELKPNPYSNLVYENAKLNDAGREKPRDFFDIPIAKYTEETDTDITDNNKGQTADGLPEELTGPVSDIQPVKRRRRKTKESEQEMLAERDAIADDLSSVSAKPVSHADAKAGAKSDDILVGGDEVISGKEYVFPSLELLKAGTKGGKSNEASIRETAQKLKSTLENFGVTVTITDYSCGPAVTRYELQPEQGVKVSKIVNLADDIKLNLAAADIRIEAPIPGKAAIGIEVPNKESSSVMFRELLESEAFKKMNSKIAFAVGKDISGQVVVADIAKMPHLLVAGSTGSGKSVLINSLIMSILYKAKPDEVKLIMVDPKQVELSIYNGIPHLLIPVVTDPKKAAGALNWAVMEMTNRYQLFAQYNVRNLEGYNAKVKTVTGTDEGVPELKKLPQIVVIVDELADLMMVAHGEVEDAIVRLTQLARAAGIHLVIATQRPSVDVITGLIKANVPSRIAMTVSSGVDSRTIIDMNGAEKLLGKGDMLYYPTGYPKPVRVQGAFLSDEEIANVTNFLKEQSGEVTYDENVSAEIDSSKAGGTSSGSSSGSDYDEYFVDAGKFIIGKEKASIGMLQRVFKIGFNRAARIMDQLEEAGVVGPEEGTKPRKVLMVMEEFENYVEENM